MFVYQKTIRCYNNGTHNIQPRYITIQPDSWLKQIESKKIIYNILNLKKLREMFIPPQKMFDPNYDYFSFY